MSLRFLIQAYGPLVPLNCICSTADPSIPIQDSKYTAHLKKDVSWVTMCNTVVVVVINDWF